MTILHALQKYPDIEADLLLGHVLKQSKEFLYIHSDDKITLKQQQTFTELAQKRQKGMPIAYLLGYKYFYGLKFKVNQNVLIPRPETEWLVDETVRITKKIRKANPKKQISILDVGTGSGCIAISVAKLLPGSAQVFATDISEKALSIASANAKTNAVTIDFHRSDLLQNISGKFRIIIANLPYVPKSDYEKLYNNLQYEPKLALTDNSNDFLLIAALLVQARKHLAKNGVILLETDPKSITHLRKTVAQLYPLKKIKVIKDIHLLERFIKIY